MVIAYDVSRRRPPHHYCCHRKPQAPEFIASHESMRAAVGIVPNVRLPPANSVVGQADPIRQVLTRLVRHGKASLNHLVGRRRTIPSFCAAATSTHYFVTAY